MKKAFTFLLYISLIFLIIYLFKVDFISLSKVKFDLFELVIALLFLFVGFFVSSVSWRESLKSYLHSISTRESIISHGLPIFSKYIPGKLWTIVGRAGLASLYINIRVKEASYVSLKEQLISIFIALLITVWLPSKVLDNKYSIVYFVGVIFLAFFLFNKKTNVFFLKVLRRLKLKLDIPHTNFKKLLGVSLYCLFYWICWMLGFYFLVASLSQNPIDLKVAFVFPFSAIIGLLAIFVPGGLGVREGIMVITLIYLGFTKEAAVSISLISRLWFLLGETFIFLFALILKYKSN